MDKAFQTVEIIRNKLKNDCEQFLITGSLAFIIHGVIPIQEIHDIDIIIVNPTQKAIQFCIQQEELNPVSDKQIYEGEHKKYRFIINGFSVDIFIEDKVKPLAPWYNYARVNPVCDIIAAKKRMNREKDWIQLMLMSRVFFTNEELIEFYINKNNKLQANGVKK